MAGSENVKKNRSGKDGFFKRIGRWFKDFVSELKKVTWPSFAKVIKQTGVVLTVVVVFLLVFLAFDSLLGYLHQLLLTGVISESVLPLKIGL